MWNPRPPKAQESPQQPQVHVCQSHPSCEYPASCGTRSTGWLSNRPSRSKPESHRLTKQQIRTPRGRYDQDQQAHQTSSTGHATDESAASERSRRYLLPRKHLPLRHLALRGLHLRKPDPSLGETPLNPPPITQETYHNNIPTDHMVPILPAPPLVQNHRARLALAKLGQPPRLARSVLEPRLRRDRVVGGWQGEC